LSEPARWALSNAAREAFTRAFQLTSGISALMLAATAVLVFVQLGRARGGGASADAAEHTGPAPCAPMAPKKLSTGRLPELENVS